MASASAGHIVLTLIQLVGNGRIEWNQTHDFVTSHALY